MSSIQHTIAFENSKNRNDKVPCALVQVYPLQLNRGPIDLAGDRTSIGRSSKCDLQVADESVSREHAEIRVTGRDAIIIDLESTNGISINDLPVQTHRLKRGDRIQLGNHVFQFIADDDLEWQYHETVYAMMTRDGMTNAYNERYLHETLTREIARCKRHSRSIAVIMIDIDNFKAINEQHGHRIGDQVLRELTQRLQTVLRIDDVLTRLGGQRFAVLMVEANLEDSAEIAERCRVAVESEPLDTTIGPIRITISLGVAAPSHGDLGTGGDLLSEAGERLREAKRRGRNRSVC